MHNEILNINIQQIHVEPGTIKFNEYESIKQQALELAANIELVEVNEENVQVSKKLLAAVNKRIKEMEEKRIAIKKEILQPYTEFEQQVKEIVTIVKEADNIVRNQLRELEEKERDEKRNAIELIFNKRIKHYPFTEIFNFDMFLKPTHLNKSTSLKSIEADMVDWLEKIDSDLKAIQSLPNSETILTEYYDTKDVSTAIRIVNEREALKQQIVKVTEPKNNDATHMYIIKITNKSDLRPIEMFMQLQDINYEIEKVEL